MAKRKQNILNIPLGKVHLPLKFLLMQVVIGEELSEIVITQEGYLALTKWITILMLRNFLRQNFP